MAVADEYLIKGTTMTTIADAIRTKSDSTGELTCPTGMVAAINSIKEPYPNGTKWTQSAATTAVSFADVCLVSTDLIRGVVSISVTFTVFFGLSSICIL